MIGAPKTGSLIHRLKIQALAGQQTNTMGEPVEDWETIGHRYAAIEGLAGKEYWDAQQVKATTSHTVSIRYFSGLTTAMRFLWGRDEESGRVFNIGSALNLEERNEWHVCKCTEVV